ncbi:cytochrome P450 [Amycolatopsis sp. H20-H5]|uniref:cytochrome P450 n=1 Tax=Amycolatopsis sp. H20-H5 TaxID=3046309 RepID=UPI002DBB1798|nr:cytochrome P450 [Amycolatopsis sp. H20-H5]MEC3978294.1 cytochrome P450 [Amycolatopsis sp. H20-H5]
MSTTTVDLTDPDLWARPDVGEIVGELRAQAPVQRTETALDGPVWSVLTYELGSQVLMDSATYSSTGGSLLGSGLGQTPAGAGKMMALSDGPRHRELRAPVLPYFSPKGVRGSADRISELAASVVADAVERGEVDLVDVLATVPLVVMCDLLGIPGDDRDLVVSVCDEAFLAQTPEARRAGHQKLIPYLFEKAMQRRMEPSDDLISTLATHRIKGRLLPIEDVVLNLDNIVVGGVQTVRHTAAMSVWTLLNRPEAWRQLADGEVDLGAATDELLRFTSVGLHVLRTATRQVELGGQVIEAGDKVAVWTWSADHDPAMFDRPGELLLDRSPNRHLALGVGAHYCVGAPLAKAELGAIYTALTDQVAGLEPVGDPVFNRSIINFGFDRLPVRLRAR